MRTPRTTHQLTPEPTPMSSPGGTDHGGGAWGRWSTLAVGGMAVASMAVGFVWLPSAQSDFAAQGLWASICRMAGVPQRWTGPQSPSASPAHGTQVVLDRTMSRAGSADAAGRGATLALQQCSMCHALASADAAVALTDVPGLAGQYREVVQKQLSDNRHGDRTSPIMQAMAARLSSGDIGDLAAYYAALPTRPARVLSDSAAGTDTLVSLSADGPATALVRVGDPMRNVAPCASCHGGVDHALGAPKLEGLPRRYLTAQLTAFASGRRTNDGHARMRNMARQLTVSEIDGLAGYYADR